MYIYIFIHTSRESNATKEFLEKCWVVRMIHGSTLTRNPPIRQRCSRCNWWIYVCLQNLHKNLHKWYCSWWREIRRSPPGMYETSKKSWEKLRNSTGWPDFWTINSHQPRPTCLFDAPKIAQELVLGLNNSLVRFHHVQFQSNFQKAVPDANSNSW